MGFGIGSYRIFSFGFLTVEIFDLFVSHFSFMNKVAKYIFTIIELIIGLIIILLVGVYAWLSIYGGKM
jgi:hypothetical protein